MQDSSAAHSGPHVHWALPAVGMGAESHPIPSQLCPRVIVLMSIKIHLRTFLQNQQQIPD